MFRSMLRNGQITLPKEVVHFFNIKEHDLMDVQFDRSGIHIQPVAVEEFSKAEYVHLAKKLDSLKRRKGKVYSSVQKARGHLDRLTRF